MVTYFYGMFNNAKLFNQLLDSWQVDSGTDMNKMFEIANVFNQNIDSWRVDSFTDMSYMFNRAPEKHYRSFL